MLLHQHLNVTKRYTAPDTIKTTHHEIKITTALLFSANLLG